MVRGRSLIQISIQEDPWNLPSSIKTLVDNIQRYVEGQQAGEGHWGFVAFGWDWNAVGSCGVHLHAPSPACSRKGKKWVHFLSRVTCPGRPGLRTLDYGVHHAEPFSQAAEAELIPSQLSNGARFSPFVYRGGLKLAGGGHRRMRSAWSSLPGKLDFPWLLWVAAGSHRAHVGQEMSRGCPLGWGGVLSSSLQQGICATPLIPPPCQVLVGI